MGAVPETAIWPPWRTARENPTLASYGDPDDATLRVVVSMSSSCLITGPGGSPSGETEATPRGAASRLTLGRPLSERLVSAADAVCRPTSPEEPP